MEQLQVEKLRKLIGFKSEIRVYESVKSTLDVALDAGGIVFAVTQTGGRGRSGRSFFSGEGGLYFSLSMEIVGGEVALGERRTPFSAGGLTIAAGIAVAKALSSYGVDAWIKWVNDVYVSGRKVCGILAERRGDRVALGIGININSTIPDELSGKAASLGLDLDMNEAAAKVLNCFYEQFVSPDIGYLNAHCLTLGKVVATSLGTGRAVEVDGDGALVVEIDGKRTRVFYGEATVLN